MQITLNLPDHVAAAFATEDDATAVALAAVTDHARAQALAAASDAAQVLLREAAAPFDGEAPDVVTVAERVAAVEDAVDTLILDSLGGSDV